jgi:hypothetical protein
MAKQKSAAMPVPLEAARQFERLEGIPLGVIAELFGRMDMPAELQAKFWQEVAYKTYLSYLSTEIRIRTNKDGSKEVTIFGLVPGGFKVFRVPDEMSEAQLSEVERAQHDGLRVWVSYQEEADGRRPVNSVEVVAADNSGQSQNQ